MKKLVKSMATLLMVAGVVGFMGCKQPTTPEVVVAPKKVGTQKINKVDYDIVEFGIWPQTKYSGDVNVLKPCEKGINAWPQNVCFTDGTDNYIKVENATPDSSCESEFTKDSTYFFKLEPIQWRVLTNDYEIPDGQNEDGTNKYKSSGKKLLFAEKALAAHKYHDTSNKYDTSDIRAYLNGIDAFKDNGFLQKAFTTAEIAKISETVVDNSAESTFGTGQTETENQYACENTNDKIFLLSQKEITTADFGFAAFDKYSSTSTRIRKTTDYARATGALIGSGDYNGNSVFWLRSPYNSGSVNARRVAYDGDAIQDDFVYSTTMGVVPALSISF